MSKSDCHKKRVGWGCGRRHEDVRCYQRETTSMFDCHYQNGHMSRFDLHWLNG